MNELYYVIGVFILITIIQNVLFYLKIGSARRSNRLEILEWRKLAEMRIHADFDSGDEFLELWECLNAHIPGDCPKCGAL